MVSVFVCTSSVILCSLWQHQGGFTWPLSSAASFTQEARFDRHFVRDLTWSRHQLEELAERRFVAAQRAAGGRLAAPSHDGAWVGDPSDIAPTSFNDLFKQVCRPALAAALLSL